MEELKMSIIKTRGFKVFGILATCIFFIGLFSIPHGISGELKTVNPGYLTVAFNGDMPGTGWQDGNLRGVDGELMQWIAGELGLKVKPALMEWSAEIASVKSGRVDIMHGIMGWTAPRSKALLMSDPIYYYRNGITQKKSNNWSRIADLEGKTVATITGFSWIPELKKIKDLKLKLYDTSDAAIRDVISGRVDCLLADPPLVQYAIATNSDWGLHMLSIEDKNLPEFPTLTGTGVSCFGMNIDSHELLKAVNSKIKEIWASCKNREIAKKYGLSSPSYFVPGNNMRTGVDRPKEWQQPSLGEGCK